MNTTFDWSGRHRSSWTLAFLIFGSILLHSAAFFFVQTTTPTRQVIPKTAQPVQLLTPFAPDGSPSPENAAALRWIAADDPALIARIAPIAPPGLLDLPFRPSYAETRTKPLPVESAGLSVPPAVAQDPLALILGSAPPVAPVAGAPLPTALNFHPPLDARAPEKKEISLAVRSTEALDATRLLAAVAEDGSVRFAFIQQSSGSREMNAEAVRIATALKFAPRTGSGVEWGEITIRWGADAAQ